MKPRTGWLGALCALLVLTGCIDTSTKVTVKPDGSGVIEKTIVLSKHLAELMISMGNKSDAATIEQGILNEKGLKADAAQMGADVSFVWAQKITLDKGNGYQVKYAFKDISKVKLNQSPAAGLTFPSSGGAGGSGSSGAPTEFMTFAFSKGPPATLTIIAPKVTQTPAKPAPQASSADTDKMMATLKPLYSDMRIVLVVEVQGTITKTNAAYASGSSVTLVDMDFAKILADDATFKKLTSTQTQSISELKNMVKSVPGVRIDTQDSVSITFK